MTFVYSRHQHWLARLVLAGLLALLACRSIGAAEKNAARAFLADLSKQLVAFEDSNRTVAAGTGSWLFFVPELRALTVGPFGSEHMREGARPARPDDSESLPAIVDFHEQLKKAGIELLLVPVPAKAAVYPEAFSQTIAPRPGDEFPRIDESFRQLYRMLAAEGVAVLDLLPVFLKHRHDDEGLVYCQTDTHWSGRGVALAAEAIAEHVRDREWLKRLPRSERATESRRVEITGDLARLAATADGKSPVREMLTLTFVGSRRDEQFAAVAPDRDSPVLLMGDSHVLVFHDPRQLAQGAGLPDQLALRLGLAVDLIGVQGSGSAATRIDLARRKDNLRGKKLVIWCFSVRELAKGAARWPKVSVIRQ